MATIKPNRPCAYIGCNQDTKDKYCPEHLEIINQRIKEKNRERIEKFRTEYERRRPSANERGYNSEWRKKRKIFLQLNPLCVKCGAPATDVDHIIPHKGDKILFWNPNNWQSLCHRCHSQKTAREDSDFMNFFKSTKSNQ